MLIDGMNKENYNNNNNNKHNNNNNILYVYPIQ